MDAEETQSIRTHSSLSFSPTSNTLTISTPPHNSTAPLHSYHHLPLLYFSSHSLSTPLSSALNPPLHFLFSRFPTFLFLYKPLNLLSFSHYNVFCTSGQLHKVKVLAVLLPFVFFFSLFLFPLKTTTVLMVFLLNSPCLVLFKAFDLFFVFPDKSLGFWYLGWSLIFLVGWLVVGDDANVKSKGFLSVVEFELFIRG